MLGIIKFPIIWFRGEGFSRGFKEKVMVGLSLKEWVGVSWADKGVRVLWIEKHESRPGVVKKYGTFKGQRGHGLPWELGNGFHHLLRWNRKVGLWLDREEPFIATKSFHFIFWGRESHRSCSHKGSSEEYPGTSLRKDQSKQTRKGVRSVRKTPQAWGEGDSRSLN